MANPRQDDKMMQSAQEALRRTSEEARKVGEDATRKSAEGAAQLSRSALDVGERAARSGAELMQHNSEMMRRVWRSYLDIVSQMTGRSGDELGRVFGISGEDTRAAAEQSSRNVDAIVDSSTVLAKGVEDISRQWFDFARDRVEHNLAQIGELAQCRSPQHIAAIQTELIRGNLETLLQISRKTAEISARVAEDAMGRMSEAARKAA